MKLKLLALCMTLFVVKGFAQNVAEVSQIFEGVKNVTLRNTGVVKKNNVVKGYYAFYEYDKVNRKTLLFKLNILDANLNSIGTKDIEGPKDWQLISSAYDGNNFCFKFYDEKAKTIELQAYDDQGNEVTSYTTNLNYKPASNSKYNSTFSKMVSPELNVDETGGFLDYTFNDPNDAFITTYVNGITKKSWQVTYEPDGKSKIMLPNFLAANDQVVLTAVSRLEKGLGNNKTDNSIVGNDAKTGTQLFDMSTEIDDNHVVPVNAIFEGDKITIIGLNYKTAKTYTKAPDGFAFIEIDKKGNILKSNFKTFEESLGKYLPMEGSELAGGYYLYIHDIIPTKNNTNLVIAEKFKKEANAAGVALSALSMLGGGGAGDFIKLQLEDMVVIEYDHDGNALQAQDIPKGKGATDPFPGSMGLANPYLLATVASMYGEMDYQYSVANEDHSKITFNFIDKDRLDPDAKKTRNFGQIKYTNGKINIDKIPIVNADNEKADLIHYYPATPGTVMEMDYYKKAKKISMEFVKLNN